MAYFVSEWENVFGIRFYAVKREQDPWNKTRQICATKTEAMILARRWNDSHTMPRFESFI